VEGRCKDVALALGGIAQAQSYSADIVDLAKPGPPCIDGVVGEHQPE
jgi:hypothetical protein